MDCFHFPTVRRQQKCSEETDGGTAGKNSSNESVIAVVSSKLHGTHTQKNQHNTLIQKNNKKKAPVDLMLLLTNTGQQSWHTWVFKEDFFLKVDHFKS